MRKEEQLALMREVGVVAVIRIDDPEKVSPVFDALLEGGIKCLEVTMTVPDAVRVISEVRGRLPEGMLLGAGTVLDSQTARAAMLAGAEFIVSPVTDYETIRLCNRYDKAVIPGALTPTEVVRAWEAGADMVKVFPASLGGPAYIRALKAPLPQISLVPTGGVSLENAGEYIRAGAEVLAVGGKLVDRKAVAEGNFGAIRDYARKLIEVVAEARRG
ncbi:MAG TPA: bifunctional 4-hydroxy-2-oxoglutarate aldolase/2-dehydro-3-deoxy-phosphogluconate aldolase [Candidatus Latescibacteria bacterium]|nr:bifunctional 4-hydroxy-2-oxoglutarate aldolase/2-dehydro-3-deoxy-phosphogluconate aldolase [Candidatus Latescibacterota bacterium]